MALNKIKTSSLDDDSVTSAKLANGAVTANDINDGELPLAKISQVNLDIAPEVLEIQVSAPQAGQDTSWLWTWLTSSLPYARRDITNSPEVQVPLYRQGTYTVNNFAAYDLFDDMTQTHSLYLKWIDGAGTDNLVSWATSTGPVSDSHPDINGGAATDVQRIAINVPATITLPTLTAPNVSYTVVNNGAGAYTFSGSANGDNPNIGPFYRGGTYTFNITAAGHPLYLTTDNGTNFSSGGYFGEYTDGVTGSRTDSGTLTIVVPDDAPDTLYYQCGNHGVMRGAITIKDLAVETNINGNPVVYFQHTQEGHKTPVELRPIPSLVNQMCLVYDAGTGKFVPQDLATYVENTPSFENKIREVAGTAELVVEDGSAVIAKVNVYDDSTYLPLTGNNPGDQAFATDTDILYIWDGSAWQQAGAANTDDLAEGSTNLFYTDTRVGTYLSGNGYDTASNIIASITDSAPTTLDTLNELAAALGDDPNFATTVTNSIADKLPLSGGTLTGTLTVTGANTHLDGRNSAGLTLDLSGTGHYTIKESTTDDIVKLGGTGSSNFIAHNISSGNVGIGTESPTAKLDVIGTINSPTLITSGGSSISPNGVTIANYTTVQRTSLNLTSSDSGTLIFNTDLNSIEFWDGIQWIATNLQPKITSIEKELWDTSSSGTLTINMSSVTDLVTVVFTKVSSGTELIRKIIAHTNNTITVTVPDEVLAYTGSTWSSLIASGDMISIQIYNADGTPSNTVEKEVYNPPQGGAVIAYPYSDNVTDSEGYRSHIFTSSDTFTIFTGTFDLEYVVVSGGGAGSKAHSTNVCGGGGGGGYRSSVVGENSGRLTSAESKLTLGPGTYTVTIGAGGTCQTGAGNFNGSSGSSSVFHTITSIGGGGGGGVPGTGLNGGSGGGAGSYSGSASQNYSGGAGTSGQGYNGAGYTGSTTSGGAGGGGGAGTQPTSRGTTLTGGNGGDGISTSIHNISKGLAGGGGGTGWNAETGGAAGFGGGGSAGTASSSNGQPGTVNTGGGGGGAKSATNAGNGGSGVVYVRYRVAEAIV